MDWRWAPARPLHGLHEPMFPDAAPGRWDPLTLLNFHWWSSCGRKVGSSLHHRVVIPGRGRAGGASSWANPLHASTWKRREGAVRRRTGSPPEQLQLTLLPLPRRPSGHKRTWAATGRMRRLSGRCGRGSSQPIPTTTTATARGGAATEGESASEGPTQRRSLHLHHQAKKTTTTTKTTTAKMTTTTETTGAVQWRERRGRRHCLQRPPPYPLSTPLRTPSRSGHEPSHKSNLLHNQVYLHRPHVLPGER